MKKLNKNYLDRYSRQIVLKNVGLSGQKKISLSKVFIVGAGGLGSPVVDFIRKGDMEIELTVNTTEIKFINIGDEVVLKDHNNIFKGKIIRKGKFVNPKTQNISVFTAITNNIGALYNGMYLTATIMTQPTKNVFKIPKRAIFENNKVFILDSEEKLVIETVDIISYQNDGVIIQGLKDNTLVVSEPLINTREGEKIKAIVK